MRRRGLCLAVGMLVLASTAGLIAGQPVYRIAVPSKDHAVGFPVRQLKPVAPYPYGWFGAKPRTHWTRHFGFHRSYTQWSSR